MIDPFGRHITSIRVSVSDRLALARHMGVTGR